MYWKKKPIQTKKPISKADQDLIKPSKRPNNPVEKGISLQLPCYLLDPKSDELVQGMTLKISKTGMLVKCLRDLKNEGEVLCLISDKRKLSKSIIKTDKNTIKGKIVLAERDGTFFRYTIQITLGRIDPFAYLGEMGDETRYWWSRHWQGLG